MYMGRLERHELMMTVLLPLEINFPRKGSAFALTLPIEVDFEARHGLKAE
jgi:hypothetical protein